MQNKVKNTLDNTNIDIDIVEYEKPPKQPILVIDGSNLSTRILKRAIITKLNLPVDTASTYEEARAFIASGKKYMAAVVGMMLPDAPEGASVDLVLEAGIPTIVLTGMNDIGGMILKRDIVDYFIKDDRSVDLVLHMLWRLQINSNIKVLVVDDTAVFRQYVSQLLNLHNFSVLEAKDGVEGLKIVNNVPDLSVIITDYNMPEMDGFEFVNNARKIRSRDDVAILGTSANDAQDMSVKFLKLGADDYISKPFLKEALYCRIYRNLETLEHIKAIKKAAYTDKLTGLNNRLIFFQKAPIIFNKATENDLDLAVIMIDIDYFKKINDAYGHSGGDAALKHLAVLMKENLKEVLIEDDAIMARLGGEEFCIVISKVNQKIIAEEFEKLRASVEASKVEFEGEVFSFTLSIGITCIHHPTLVEMINSSDELLYEAKKMGRNKVVIES